MLAAAGHTVVCPDLRGCGQSSKPPITADHTPYSKRAMAGDVLALMHQLGHERFSVVGHDRGSIGTDTPARRSTSPMVSRLLDIITSTVILSAALDLEPV